MKTLSHAALALLHACVNGEGNPRVDDTNLAVYRELAAAEVMYPVSTFVGGPESVFRFTEIGWADRHRILARDGGSHATAKPGARGSISKCRAKSANRRE